MNDEKDSANENGFIRFSIYIYVCVYCIVEIRRVDSRRREKERERKGGREKSGKSLILAKIFAARGRGGVASIYDPPKSRPSSPRS